jgi:hypothetical protein
MVIYLGQVVYDIDISEDRYMVSSKDKSQPAYRPHILLSTVTIIARYSST